MCASRLCRHSRGTAGTGGIYSSACDGRTDTCAFALCHRSVAGVAAGVTWTSRTTSAPWGARWKHTTVIDAGAGAAGAIYVLGGADGLGGGRLNDVWVSTNGGADRTRRVLGGYLVGTTGVLRGIRGY